MEKIWVGGSVKPRIKIILRFLISFQKFFFQNFLWEAFRRNRNCLLLVYFRRITGYFSTLSSTFNLLIISILPLKSATDSTHGTVLYVCVLKWCTILYSQVIISWNSRECSSSNRPEEKSSTKYQPSYKQQLIYL